MNTSLAPVDFDGLTLSLLPHANDVWLTAADIGRALEYADPKDVLTLFERNRDELDEYSTTLKLRAVDGKERDTRVFNEEGVMLLAMASRQPRARAFRRWAVRVLRAYRHGQFAEQTLALEALHAELLGVQRQLLATQGRLIERLDAERLQPQPRRWWTPTEAAEVWRLHAEGQRVRDIARALGRPRASISTVLRRPRVEV
ncbi:MAG: helix-turn-helix domain-containing protein [Ideonella sp.]|nr:helix-turn-helix domain-containing protein [Ideonella sp.]